MTTNEKKQPNENFFRAGELAFLIGVAVTDNPYKEEPYRGLWTKGWRIAKLRFDAARRPRTNVRPGVKRGPTTKGRNTRSLLR